MPDSGSGVGTPITGGAPSGMPVRALPYTLLSLERYAQLMSLNPAHFNQSYSDNVFPITSSCQDVWYKYSWQRIDVVSREELAYAIKQAEEDIADVLGYWPAPKWTASEKLDYDHHYLKDRWTIHGLNTLLEAKTVTARKGKVLAPGRRVVALAGDSIGVSYSDEDGDGLNETATITVDISGTAAETVLDSGYDSDIVSSRGLKVYFEDQGGHQDWEIRTPISRSYSGTTLTVIYRCWQLIRPELLEEYPQITEEPFPIDISDSSNLVDAVDVYLEYTDPTQVSVEFVWRRQQSCTVCNGSGCEVCNPYSVNGCLTVADSDAAILSPVPGSYSVANSRWEKSSVSVSREPDYVRAWYYSGYISDDYLNGYTDEPLSHSFAQATAWLATARLHDEICACGNAKAIADNLRKNFVVSTSDGAFILPVDEAVENPFGIKVGEVMAWRKIRRINPDIALTGYAL